MEPFVFVINFWADVIHAFPPGCMELLRELVEPDVYKRQALDGWPVTVFEALPRPGGMLRYGIPAYRLPDAVIDAQIRQLEALGVEFRCGVRIGEGKDLGMADLEDLGFRAVLLAPGLSAGKRLALEGMDLHGVHTGVEFLRALRMGGAPATCLLYTSAARRPRDGSGAPSFPDP